MRGDSHPFALVGAWAGGGALVGLGARARGGRGRGSVRAARPPARPCRRRRRGGGRRRLVRLARLRARRAGRAAPARAAATRSAARRRSSRSTTTCCAATPTAAGGSRRSWSDGRGAALRARLDCCAAGSPRGRRRAPVWVGTVAAAPGAGGHPAAVRRLPRADRRRRGLPGQPLPAARGDAGRATRSISSPARTRALGAGYAALRGGPVGRRSRACRPSCSCAAAGDEVPTEPIKGTAPRTRPARRSALRELGEGPRRARDDRRPDAQRPRARLRVRQRRRAASCSSARAHPGVWHLVSTVAGRLRAGRRRRRAAARHLPARLGDGRAQGRGRCT